MGPIRELGRSLMATPVEHVRPINISDFAAAIKVIRPSVSPSTLQMYDDWSNQFGTRGA